MEEKDPSVAAEFRRIARLVRQDPRQLDSLVSYMNDYNAYRASGGQPHPLYERLLASADMLGIKHRLKKPERTWNRFFYDTATTLGSYVEPAAYTAAAVLPFVFPPAAPLAMYAGLGSSLGRIGAEAGYSITAGRPLSETALNTLISAGYTFAPVAAMHAVKKATGSGWKAGLAGVGTAGALMAIPALAQAAPGQMGATYATHRPISTDIERVLGGIGGLVANTAKWASPRNALAAGLTFGAPLLNAFTTPRGTQQAGSFGSDILAGLTGLGAGLTGKYLYRTMYPPKPSPAVNTAGNSPAPAAPPAVNHTGNVPAPATGNPTQSPKKSFFPFLFPAASDSDVVSTGVDAAGIPEYELKKPVTIKPPR